MRLVIFVFLASACFAQDVKRPTSEMDSGATVKCGVGTKQTSVAMPNAYDAAGQSTSSNISAIGSLTTSFYRSRSFATWQSGSSTYSALTLNVNSQESEGAPTGSSGQGAVRYSIDGGLTWSDLITSTSGGWSRKTQSVTLSTSQDLSQLKVAACVESRSGGDQPGLSELLTVFDIWTAGTTTPQGAGTGASSGSPHRGMVIVN